MSSVFQWDDVALQQLIGLLNKQTNNQSINQLPTFLLARSHQSNSQSVISSKQLLIEINQLTDCNDRIAIKRLSELIGINQSIIEQAIKSINQSFKHSIHQSNIQSCNQSNNQSSKQSVNQSINQSNRSLYIVYDDVINQTYIDRLIDTFKSDLNDQSIGYVSLTNQSIKLSIPLDFLRQHVVDRLHSQSINQTHNQSIIHSFNMVTHCIQPC
jgi:hypothetical protein